MRDGFYYSYSRKMANPPYFQLNHQGEAGYALIVFSWCIFFILVLLIAGYLSLQANQIDQIEREICSIKAFYIAQAGLKKIAKDPRLQQDPNLMLTGSFGKNDKIYDEAYRGKLDRSSKPPCLLVTGMCQTKDKHIVAQRTLKAEIGSTSGGLPFPAPAVYIKEDPSFSAIPGDIYGKCLDAERGKYSIAIQSGGKIKTELFNTIPIKFHDEFLSFVELGCKQGEKCELKDWWYPKIETKQREEGERFRISLNIQLSNPQSLDPNAPNYWLTQPPMIKDSDPAYNCYYHDPADNIEYRGRAGGVKGSGMLAELLVKREYVLHEGNYYFTKIELQPNAKLKIKGKVKIFCTNEMRLGKSSQIGDPNQIGNLSLRSYSTGSWNPTMYFNEKSKFFGIILVPRCEMILYSGEIYIQGGIVAWRMRDFKLQGTSMRPWRIEFDPAFEQVLSEFGGESGAPVLANWRELKDHLPLP